MTAKADEPATVSYFFGAYVFIPQKQLLLRDGHPVKLGGRAFDILTLLVRRRGEVVSKSELLAFCWPSTYVHEDNLKVNVAALRRTLDVGGGTKYIATVPNRGYRFIGEISEELAEPNSAKTVSAQVKPIRRPRDLIGRAAEVRDLSEILRSTRCLTIVGPGGIGKTTLALELAHQVSTDFPHGVVFIDMSTVGDMQYVTAAIAAGVGAWQRSADSISEITAILYEQKILLVLDNCEHLSASVSSVVSRLLEAVPGLTILATSREPLVSAFEQLHRLSSLEVPPSTTAITADEAMSFSAIRLFVARASSRTDYIFTDADAPTVAAICRRLDGIPLAIELAASKTLTYGVASLLEMLEQKFLLLTNGERTAPYRQQTMLATLDWSYRLLTDDEAALLRLISVFAGPFQIADAVAVAEALGFAPELTAKGIGRLVAKSLVYVEHRDSLETYRLLESTRAFSSERLYDSGERDVAVGRYAVCVLELFERAAAEADNRDKFSWMAEYSQRIDDARTVMDWAFGPHGSPIVGVRLTAAAIPLWYELSALDEMRSRVESAIVAARQIESGAKELTMRLVAARASGLAFGQHVSPDTEAAWKECYELGVEMASVKYQLMGLWGLSSYLLYTGRPVEALAELERVVFLAKAQSDLRAVDEAHRMMATAEIYIGDIGVARKRLERIVAQHQRGGAGTQVARFLSEHEVGVRSTLSLALWISGEPTRAIQVVRGAIERAKISGHEVTIWNSLVVFAIPIAFWSADYAAAEEFLVEAEQVGRMEAFGAWKDVCRFYGIALRAKRKEPEAPAKLAFQLEEMMAAKQVLRAPMYYAMLAEALIDIKEYSEAEVTARKAYELAIEHDANWCMPEIIRLSGLAKLGLGQRAAAERLFGTAIAKASFIGALTLELRATIALCHLLEESGRSAQARQLLDSICARFTKFEAHADLLEARSLARRLQSYEDDVPLSA